MKNAQTFMIVALFTRSKRVNDWVWDSKNPNQITCKESGVTFPNDQYKTKIFKAQVLSGSGW